jgi:hypothetical protein
MGREETLMGALLVLAAAAVAAYGVSLWLHPWRPCRACDGGKRRDPVWRRAYGHCRSCGGTGRKPRAGIVVLQWARARKMTPKRDTHKLTDHRDGR